MRRDGPDFATPAPGEILDAAGVCALLGIGRSTLTRYVNGEGLPHFRLGTHLASAGRTSMRGWPAGSWCSGRARMARKRGTGSLLTRCHLPTGDVSRRTCAHAVVRRTLRPMAGTPLHHRSAPRSVWNEPTGRSAVPGAR